MYLYIVKLRGMIGKFGNGVEYGISYVVANSPSKAYEIVRKFLDKEDIGFSAERELKSVELVAEKTRYPDCKTILFIQEQ